MLVLPAGDHPLLSLERATIPSSASEHVVYRLDRVLGQGGMSVAFFALRAGPDGETPTVLKILEPRVLREAGAAAMLVVQKETVALGRLNERVPPSPFVVRLIEGGSVAVEFAGTALDLPWLAIEYVHGGVEGTTLEERLQHSVSRTGFAFDPDRAEHALDCISRGLDAIHEVGVIHRDIKAANVLCSGFGDEEVFKIADFGIARPKGVAATFGGIPVGTPGYAAPEQVMLDDKRIGPATDVFSLAALLFRMLTCEEYFPVRTAVEAVVLAQDSRRRSVLETRWLSPELRSRDAACHQIDAILARATSPDPQHRPEAGGLLAAMARPHLRPESRRLRPTERRLRSIAVAHQPTLASGWRWTVRQRSGADRVVRSVAWDGTSCLAATERGLEFWNGTSWVLAPLADFPAAGGARFVRRTGPGQWILGGDEGIVARYSSDGVTDVIRAGEGFSIQFATGDLTDLAVIVGTREGDTPVLFGYVARRWLKPIALRKAASVASIARVADARWLVAGRSTTGDGYVAEYSPLLFELERRKTSPVRAFLGCAGQSELGLGIAVGASGRALTVREGEAVESVVPGEPDLSAVALDISGTAWAASRGTLWLRSAESAARWACAWNDPSWNAPFVSVFAEVGLVLAMTADGAIVEGRLRERMEPNEDRAGSP